MFNKSCLVLFFLIGVPFFVRGTEEKKVEFDQANTALLSVASYTPEELDRQIRKAETYAWRGGEGAKYSCLKSNKEAVEIETEVRDILEELPSKERHAQCGIGVVFTDKFWTVFPYREQDKLPVLLINKNRWCGSTLGPCAEHCPSLIPSLPLTYRAKYFIVMSAYHSMMTMDLQDQDEFSGCQFAIKETRASAEGVADFYTNIDRTLSSAISKLRLMDNRLPQNWVLLEGLFNDLKDGDGRYPFFLHGDFIRFPYNPLARICLAKSYEWGREWRSSESATGEEKVTLERLTNTLEELENLSPQNWALLAGVFNELKDGDEKYSFFFSEELVQYDSNPLAEFCNQKKLLIEGGKKKN